MIDQTTKDALNQHIVQTLWKRGEYDIYHCKEAYNSALTDVQKLIESLSYEKEGEWTRIKHHSPYMIFKCSECKGAVVLPIVAGRCYYDYCPNCGTKMKAETKNKTENSPTDLQKNIDVIRGYEALKERFKPYLPHCLSEYPDIVDVTWYEDENEFEVWYEETFCGHVDKYSEDFPANIFDMTPEEYKEIVKKKEQEEARRKALEREQNERRLLAKLTDEVKDIFRKAEGILLNEEDK